METDILQLRSPIAPFTGQTIPLRIGLSPILRAGIGLTDGESHSSQAKSYTKSSSYALQLRLKASLKPLYSILASSEIKCHCKLSSRQSITL